MLPAVGSRRENPIAVPPGRRKPPPAPWIRPGSREGLTDKVTASANRNKRRLGCCSPNHYDSQWQASPYFNFNVLRNPGYPAMKRKHHDRCSSRRISAFALSPAESRSRRVTTIVHIVVA